MRKLIWLILPVFGTLSISTLHTLTFDVVNDGVVQSAWMYPGLDTSRTDLLSYMKFYVASPDATLHLASRAVGDQIILPALYDKVPGDTASLALNMTLCTE